MATGHNSDELPTYAPHSLNLHMKPDISYDMAKQLAESYGLTVLPQDLLWDRFSLLETRIPPGENLDEWIAKLRSEAVISRITKVASYFLDSIRKT